MYCKYCGNKIDENSKFCNNCGAKVNINNIQNNSSDVNKNINNNKNVKVEKSENKKTFFSNKLVLFLFIMNIFFCFIGIIYDCFLDENAMSGFFIFVFALMAAINVIPVFIGMILSIINLFAKKIWYVDSFVYR